MIKLGEKIKQLRTQKAISQEVLAGCLGVSFQAVSKWETGTTMPDVMLIPSIASFFGVSTDELFDFNVYEIEREAERIRDEAYECRRVGKLAEAETILRKGLKRFPGNELLLNNLLYVLDMDTQSEEVISLCKRLIETTHKDDVKYDACRILAECYKEIGKDALVKATLEKIPEIYFSKLQLMALLLDGEEAYHAAQLQLGVSLEQLLSMLSCIAKHEQRQGHKDEAIAAYTRAVKVLDAMEPDITDSCWKGYYERLQSAMQNV